MFVPAYGPNCTVETYDARFPLHSLLVNPFASRYHSYKAAGQWPDAQSCAYIILGATPATVNSIQCETPGRINIYVSAIFNCCRYLK
jgi:hypothetical protein